MELLNALASRIPGDYAFSAFALALLMLPVYFLLKNPAVLQLIDRSLNVRLGRTHLYKFLRLGVLLVFVFSLIVAVLAFLAPVFMQEAQRRKVDAENRQIELYRSAQSRFDAKDLSGARELYQQALNISPDSPRADEIQGMITATYYGQGLHEEGLQSICDRYANRSTTDQRHVFAVHAHLRALALRQGATHAEEKARAFAQRCQRDDFQPYWAHIPFGMMESLRQGRLRSEHNWELTPEARERLAQLLDEARQQARTAMPPFADVVLYFLGDFDAVIDRFKGSRIRDIALFDAAKFSSGEGRVAYLVRLFNQHPESVRYEDAASLLIDTLAEMGRRAEALQYVMQLRQRIPTGLEAHVAQAIGPSMGVVQGFVKSGEFGSGLSLVDQVCADLSAQKMACPATVLSERRKLVLAKDTMRRYPDPAQCLISHAAMRGNVRDADGRRDGDWTRGLRARLMQCLPALRKAHPDHYARALYVIGSLSRQVDDTDVSVEYLERFDREIQHHELSDDVLVELLHHHLNLREDVAAATPYWQRILSEHRESNAFDNALWWVAKHKVDHGDFVGGAQMYAQISSISVSRRLKEWSAVKAQGIERLAAYPFGGMLLKQRWGGLYPERTEGSAGVRFVRDDSEVVQACGRKVRSLHDLLEALQTVPPTTACEVWMRHADGDYKLIPGKDANAWRTATLSPNEQQVLALQDEQGPLLIAPAAGHIGVR